jgi:phage tail protein X
MGQVARKKSEQGKITMAGLAFLYITMDGDRWDNIAWKFYGDPTMIGPILQANCGAKVPFAATLKGGIQLRIPIIVQSDINTENLPPWVPASR